MSTKQLMNVAIACALLAVLPLAAGCASSDGAPTSAEPDRGGESTVVPGGGVVLGADDDGTAIELNAGQMLMVTLESNPTTGYSWEVSEVDRSVLSQVGEAEFQEAPKEDEQMVGVGGTETFRFASAPGSTTLTLVYHRSWETNVEPVDTFTVEVTVR
ncbi:MAG: protease inhibitor I42 family protein [Anaerolineae bacterium]|jgi:inhibitor of cysteine peptidase